MPPTCVVRRALVPWHGRELVATREIRMTQATPDHDKSTIEPVLYVTDTRQAARWGTCLRHPQLSGVRRVSRL